MSLIPMFEWNSIRVLWIDLIMLEYENCLNIVILTMTIQNLVKQIDQNTSYLNQMPTEDKNAISIIILNQLN